MLVDSHCHIQMLEEDPKGILKQAQAQGIEHVLCVDVDFTENLGTATFLQYAGISISTGLHPNNIVAVEPTFDEILARAQNPRVVAIGETGLDCYRSDNLTVQEIRFATHIAAAKASGKPLIVHTRMAKEATIAVLKAEDAQSVGGVLHCFTEDWPMAQQALDLNFYISFSGIVTFQNAKALQEVAHKIPLDRILIETDAPYLAPIPHRGKSNQPAWVRLVAEFLAEQRGMSLEAFAQATTQNFYRLFQGAQAWGKLEIA